VRSTESYNTHAATAPSLSPRREPDPCFNLIEILSWPVCQLDKLLQSPPHITHFASFAGQIIREPQFGDLPGSWGIYYLFSSLVLRGGDDGNNAPTRGDIDTSTSCMMQNFHMLHCTAMKRQSELRRIIWMHIWIDAKTHQTISFIVKI
jgi:hypothetical protein